MSFFSFYFLKPNKNLDMSINASNNFNLNITWSVGSTGNFTFDFHSKNELNVEMLFGFVSAGVVYMVSVCEIEDLVSRVKSFWNNYTLWHWKVRKADITNLRGCSASPPTLNNEPLPHRTTCTPFSPSIVNKSFSSTQADFYRQVKHRLWIIR